MASLTVPFAGVQSGAEELAAVQRVLASGWLAAGPEGMAFEQEFARFTKSRYAVCVNSGSSGLLLALKALRLPPGSHVLTSACGFPATLAPILHCGFTPVFVDAELPSHNFDISQAMEKTTLRGPIRAVILAHTLGNPVNLTLLFSDMCRRRNISLIEDCCEAVGTTYYDKPVGSIGRLGVFSFYPSHQMTALGGGGMVVCQEAKLAHRLRSLRDWGKRSDHSTAKVYQTHTQYTTPLRGEPFRYYKSYIYDTVGFNMKLPDVNAAFGRVQLMRLQAWKERRQQLFDRILTTLKELELPHTPIQAPLNSDPNWFGFPITFRQAGLRDRFGDYLESCGVAHRPFFAGNLLRQPAFRGLDDPAKYPVADYLMRNSLFVGVWPGLTEEQVLHLLTTLRAWNPSP